MIFPSSCSSNHSLGYLRVSLRFMCVLTDAFSGGWNLLLYAQTAVCCSWMDEVCVMYTNRKPPNLTRWQGFKKI